MHEAETLAERLNDDRRRGRVYAGMTNAHTLLGELDEALVAGTRALEIAARLSDLRLRILATTYLAQAHHFRGDFERAVELATESLGALPADWVYEPFGNSPVSLSVFIRLWVVHGLAELGRFAEAAPHEAELLRLAGPSQHAYTVGEAHNATGMLHLRKGDWATARSEIELSIAAYRTGNIAVVLTYHGRRLGLGPRAGRRSERGADPATRERAAPRATSGAGSRSHELPGAGSCRATAQPAR